MSILQYFQPSLSYQLSLKTLVLSTFEWPFYTGFTVRDSNTHCVKRHLRVSKAVQKVKFFNCDLCNFKLFHIKRCQLSYKDINSQKNHDLSLKIIEPVHEISNNVVCATSKASDQPAHMRSLIRAFACRLNII